MLPGWRKSIEVPRLFRRGLSVANIGNFRCIDVVCNLRAMRKLLQPPLFPPFLPPPQSPSISPLLPLPFHFPCALILRLPAFSLSRCSVPLGKSQSGRAREKEKGRKRERKREWHVVEGRMKRGDDVSLYIKILKMWLLKRIPSSFSLFSLSTWIASLCIVDMSTKNV